MFYDKKTVYDRLAIVSFALCIGLIVILFLCCLTAAKEKAPALVLIYGGPAVVCAIIAAVLDYKGLKTRGRRGDAFDRQLKDAIREKRIQDRVTR